MNSTFTLVIPTYNSSCYVEELLDSAIKINNLTEVIITDDNSNKENTELLDKIVNSNKYANLNIKLYKNKNNLGGFRNKLNGVELSSNNLIYQVDSDNVISKKTIRFLNNKKNLMLINKGELYLPSKIRLFRKFKLIESLLFYRNNDVLFTKKNKFMSIYDVKKELNSDLNSFKDRTLKSILNIGNPIFLKKDYIDFCKEGLDLQIDISAGDAIALSYFYLKNNGKIVFNKNLSHFHRMRDDSYWHTGGEQSKKSDLHFLNKIIEYNMFKKLSRQKAYFITYGTKNFRVAKSHLISVAKESGLFEKVIGFNQKSLSNEFKEKFEEILKSPRGAGYWIWKHEIISNVLESINENDLVIYSDSGSSFNYFAKQRFNQYLEILNNSDYGNFRIECESVHKENKWTTSELFEYFDVDIESNIAKSTQLEATHIIFKKNTHTNDYLNEYKKLLNKDPYLITDKYNSFGQVESFKENRHDQSIFSLLSKIYGGEIVSNETHFMDKRNDQLNYPFLAVRKHGHGLKDSVKFLINYKNIKYSPVYFQ